MSAMSSGETPSAFTSLAPPVPRCDHREAGHVLCSPGMAGEQTGVAGAVLLARAVCASAIITGGCAELAGLDDYAAAPAGGCGAPIRPTVEHASNWLAALRPMPAVPTPSAGLGVSATGVADPTTPSARRSVVPITQRVMKRVGSPPAFLRAATPAARVAATSARYSVKAARTARPPLRRLAALPRRASKTSTAGVCSHARGARVLIGSTSHQALLFVPPESSVGQLKPGHAAVFVAMADCIGSISLLNPEATKVTFAMEPPGDGVLYFSGWTPSSAVRAGSQAFINNLPVPAGEVPLVDLWAMEDGREVARVRVRIQAGAVTAVLLNAPAAYQ